MKESLKLQVEISKLQEKANAEGVTDEQRTAYRKENADLQKRFREAVEAEHREAEENRGDENGTPEQRELATLEARADVGAIFDATLAGRPTEGAEAELQKHLGMAANQVPLALMRERNLPDLPGVERRTTGGTAAPADVGQTQNAIIPAVFPQSAAAWLGVSMPEAASWGRGVHRLCPPPRRCAHPGGERRSGRQRSGVHGAHPHPVEDSGVSLHYTREDRARLAGMGEALRMNLSDALLRIKLDDEVLTGTEWPVHRHQLGRQRRGRGRQRTPATGSDSRTMPSMAPTRPRPATCASWWAADTYGDMAASYRSNQIRHERTWGR